MNYETIRVSPGAVTWLTLSRPEVMNAYNTQMIEDLNRALLAFQRDDEARVLVLTGEGRAFSSGGDVRSTDEADEGDERILGHGMVMREGMHSVVRALYNQDKPVIGLINGAAVAGGLTLAQACDVRIAGESARLGDPSGRAGLMPDEGGAWFFSRAMGRAAAYRMWLFGEIYDAHRAMELGLVDEVVADDELKSRGEELANRISAGPPLAARLTKRLYRRAATSTLDEALYDAEMAVDIGNRSSDVTEGVRAFVERREPKFTGR